MAVIISVRTPLEIVELVMHSCVLSENFGRQNLASHGALLTVHRGVDSYVETHTVSDTHSIRHTQYPTPEEYNEVCKILIQKHPILKDTIGNGYVSNTVILNIKAWVKY